MLQISKAFSSFSVNDLAEAKHFYGQLLGLKIDEEDGMGLALHLNEGSEVFVYPKDDHVPATFTVLNFRVENIDTAVDTLTAKGITFERYNQPQLQTDHKGISRSTNPENGPSIAWFKDPAGNLLSLLQ